MAKYLNFIGMASNTFFIGCKVAPGAVMDSAHKV